MNILIDDFRKKVEAAKDEEALALIWEAWEIERDVEEAEIPSWFDVLADANPGHEAEALDEAQIHIRAERLTAEQEARERGAVKGQSLVEVALLLGFLAVGLLIFWAWFTTTPAYMGMLELTAGAATSLEATVNQDLSHGLERHGAKASAVYDCLNRNGTYQVWHNPTTNRRANICQTSDGRWGAQIVNDANEEITAFINKATEYSDFARYLRNAGYLPPQ